ncbi:P2X purinoceptor 7-like [Ixodes scapularis]
MRRIAYRRTRGMNGDGSGRRTGKKRSPSRHPFSRLKTSLAQSHAQSAYFDMNMHAYDFFTSCECGQCVVLPDFEPRECLCCREICSKLSEIESTGCITTNV